ncbi:hypothetical protein EZS27_043502, partial [termite gut metagenome]
AIQSSGIRTATQTAPRTPGPFPIISRIHTSLGSATLKDSPLLKYPYRCTKSVITPIASRAVCERCKAMYIKPEKIGYETCAYIGINLKNPESFHSVLKELEKISEVVECHFTTGKYDMFIKIYAKNNYHLLNIIHDRLQPLAVARTETLISFHEALKRQISVTFN